MRYLRILCICVIQLFLSAVAFAQTQVTGHVADVRGEDIIGANVTVKGTSNGTITDIDGNFTINVDDKNGTLAVSFIGYKTKEVKIGEKARLQIVLEEDTETLDEVVVVGYGTQTKKSLTGAISDVKSDALTRSAGQTHYIFYYILVCNFLTILLVINILSFANVDYFSYLYKIY